MKVRIFRQGKSAMQSGRGNEDLWILEYETISKRAPESLMGWTASGDTLNQIRLTFDTAEEAEAFAKRKGWIYSLQKPRKRKIKPRNYTDNFRYVPVEDV